MIEIKRMITTDVTNIVWFTLKEYWEIVSIGLAINKISNDMWQAKVNICAMLGDQMHNDGAR